jgi:cobalt-zinc-cadmium efflux system protein
VTVEELSHHLTELAGIVSIHHVHIRSLDGNRHYATLHAVIDGDPAAAKAAIRAELAEHGITHATIETETPDEVCGEVECRVESNGEPCGGHHHHHH